MTLARLMPILILAWALALGACGDGGGGDVETTPTPNVRVVTSDDGKLTLEIPRDALEDEEIEISATAVPLDELPEEMQLVQGAGTGYRLEPDGLEFSQPVAVSLDLDRAELDDEPPGQLTAYALVSFVDGGELEVLPEQSTKWTIGDDTVVVRGELTHFSWIVETKGSLVVLLEEVPRFHPIGGTFTAQGSVGNGASPISGVTMEGAGGEFLAFGTVSITGATSFAGNADLVSNGAVRGTGEFQCAATPGLGAYTLVGKATSVVVIDDEPMRTSLTVTVDGVVECVVATPTPAPPTATPTPSEDMAVTEVTVIQSPGCAHTQPGVQSELQTEAVLWWDAPLPPSLITVEMSATGPGLLQSTASGTTDKFGIVNLVFPIDQFGQYQMTIDGVTGPDGPLQLSKGSQISATFDVGDVCTPAGQAPEGVSNCGAPGDVDGDGSVTALDALLVIKFVAGEIDSLPCTEGADVNGDDNINFDDATEIGLTAAGL